MTEFGFDQETCNKLKLDGLIPALDSKEITGSEYQYNVAMKRFDRLKEPLDKYDWLMTLADRNKRLFYTLLSRNPKKIMPFVYTPTVGDVCLDLALHYRPGRGLFINKYHTGKIEEILANWFTSDVLSICVTDGERILGLGDLGAYGMGIPVGKLALYTALAGIDPKFLLPVTLDLGTNNEKLLQSPDYFGLKEKRLTGPEYDAFIDEFMRACVKQFGKDVLIQFEDFANHNAFRLLEKYAPTHCTFNDDIQGTASVVLAALLGSERITKRKLNEEIIISFGAGEAALGLAHLVVRALQLRHGMTEIDAKKNIYVFDSKGLVIVDRSTGGLTEAKLEFARPKGTPETTDLIGFIKQIKPTCLLGASAVANSFSADLLKSFAQVTETPVVMALSNPTSKAECSAQEAYHHTEGKAIFASGSPFDQVTLSGDIKIPSQANNAYIFPGIALGIIVGKIQPVTNDDFLLAAETVANMTTQEELDMGSVLPSFDRIRLVSKMIAKNVINFAIKERRSHHIFTDQSALDNAVDAASTYPEF
ncbi:hypothetical protein Ciccas_001129 [Cichlidogyrus casuarinus]|uniref:Malic enzyme n=1 Tax=Cichlidogyrus casuarinus TaxID=1844966 RepID=A0ABD2QKY3_9PLAT